jgi:flagellar biosynthetic protein FliS
MNAAEMYYRKAAAAASVSGIGLLIALYDTLASDIRRAVEAERSNDLERRCRELNHALLVIGHLEDCLERGSGGDLAAQLRGLYNSLRHKLVEAQAKRSALMLEEQMGRVLEIRATWQSVALRQAAQSSGPEILPPSGQSMFPGMSALQADSRHLSWSA